MEDDIVSAVIVRTCRILPRSSRYDDLESMQCQGFKTLDGYYNFLCGSCAEFFIQPLQRCISDVDYCAVNHMSLAFTKEKPVLPYDNVRYGAEKVICQLMEPYLDYPAFVRLLVFGEMMYNSISKTYEFRRIDAKTFTCTPEIDDYNKIDEGSNRVGPALKVGSSDKASHTTDIVDCIWCPQWPNEARGWPFRQRNQWPTTAVIHEVVQNGCHVVTAKHYACKDDRHQWRLSFSAAEVILLQSWTPIHQILYHMLRFFAKRELIQKDCLKKDEVLCTYHFKTLMLWSCEEMSAQWWESSSVIQLCCLLLKKLSKWLKETRCPNYFIPKANLFHEQFNRKIVDQTVEKLIYYSITDNLSLWFEEHYIKPRFPNLFDAKCTRDVLISDYFLKTLEAMKASNYPKSIDHYVSVRFGYDRKCTRDPVLEVMERANLNSFDHCLRFGSPVGDQFDFLPVPEFASCYLFYGSMLRVLSAVRLLATEVMAYPYELWLAEVIIQVSNKEKHVISKHQNLPSALNTNFNERQQYLRLAQDLMKKLNESSDDLEPRVVSEISKRLLKSAMEYKDHETNIACATLSYVADVHSVESEFQTLTTEIVNEKRKKESQTLNSECWQYISQIIYGFYFILLKIKESKEKDYAYERWLARVMRQVSNKEKHVISKHHNLLSAVNTDDNKSQQYLRIAQDLMKNLNGSNEESEFEVLSEISKPILWSALECDDDKRNIIANAAFAYLAALHFAASQYQTVIDICSRVIAKENPEKDETEPLNAGCLLFIEDISKIIGFYLIFLKTKSPSLYYTRRPVFLDLRLTPEVFAYYLLNASIDRTARGAGLNVISQIQAFPLDAILMAITKRKRDRPNVLLAYQRIGLHSMDVIESHYERCLLNYDDIIQLPNDVDVIQLLKQYSLGYMEKFYNSIYKEFDIDCSSTVHCYRAAFLYECRKYLEVLNLCERILNEADLRSELKKYAFANIMVLPPLDVFFDRDIQCLLGLYTILCNLSPSNESLVEIRVSETSIWQAMIDRNNISYVRSLSAVLLKSYSKKCHYMYFLGRHFLARYLKLRCLIDCKHSISEVMIEFKKLKCNLPYENIIHCFLQQKLCRLQKIVAGVT